MNKKGKKKKRQNDLDQTNLIQSHKKEGNKKGTASIKEKVGKERDWLGSMEELS